MKAIPVYTEELLKVVYTELRRRYPIGTIPEFQINLDQHNNIMEIFGARSDLTQNFVKHMKKQFLYFSEDEERFYLNSKLLLKLSYSNYIVTSYGVIFSNVMDFGLLKFRFFESGKVPINTFDVDAGSYIHAFIKAKMNHKLLGFPFHKIDFVIE
ncbi:MAG: hypothetical protein IBX70_12145 [Clostridia bacterium]|nr:hypothetical protein [Clostridia bacterium]